MKLRGTEPRKGLSGNPDKLLIETERMVTRQGLAKISSGLLPENTVLLSSRAPVGYLALTKIKTAINQGFIAMKCNGDLSPEFVIEWADSAMDEIKQRATGTTFAEISKKSFRSIKVLVPSRTVISEYTRIASAIYEKISQSTIESRQLTEIRDALLPKLMSGEISVMD